MAQAQDAVWLPVLPSMKGFGPALIKGAGSEADKSGKAIGAKLGTALVAGVAVAGAGLGAAGAALYKVGEVFDEVTDTIRTGTGATGKALDGLVGVAKSVGTKVPADFSKIGTVVADVNTRMGLSGPVLEKVASQYLEAGRILGQDVDIAKTSAAFNAFKIEGEDVSGAMDHLFQVSQATGLGMNELAEAAARNAPAMQTLGFSFQETTAMVGSFDKAGLNSGAIMASMSKGLVTLAKDGEQPAEAFKRVQGEIAGFIDKGDQAGALNLASKVFGTKGATQFIGALKSGTLNFDDMSKAAGQTGDTILGVGEETMDFAEQWQVFKNKVLVWLEPMAAKVFGGMAFFMGEVSAGVTAFGAAWAANDGDITSSGIPGMFEQLAYWGRQAFDYVQNTALPAIKDFGGLLADTFGPALERVGEFVRDTLVPNLQAFGGYIVSDVLPALQNIGSFILTEVVPALGQFSMWILDNQDKIGIIAGVIAVILIPALVRLGVNALISAGKQVLAWVMAQAGAIKTGIVYVAQSIIIIGRWVAIAAAALVNGIKIATVWTVQIIGSAVRGAIAFGVQAAKVAAGWVVMSAAAVTSGIKTAAVWTGTVVAQAATGAIKFLLHAGKVVGGWLLMSTQSLFHAGRMALAWFIALGPIGWVIAAVIGLVAVVILNWDKISAFTRDMWEKHIKPIFDKLATFITKNVPDAFKKGVGFIGEAWKKLQDLAKVPVKFVIETIINKGLIAGLNNIGKFVGLPKIPDVPLPAGFMNGGYTGDGPKRQVKGPVHAGEYVFTKEETAALGKENLRAIASAAVRGHGGHDHAAYAGRPMAGSLPFIQSPLQSEIARTRRLNLVPFGGFPMGDLQMAARAWNGRAGVTLAAARTGSRSRLENSVFTGFGPVPSGAIGYYSGRNISLARNNAMHRETLIHEVGHALGIHHNTGNNSIMHPMLRGGGAVWPTAYDTANLRALYGAPGSGAKPAADDGSRGGGWNPLGDIVNGLLDQFKKAFTNAGFIADLAIGLGKKLIDGAVDFVTGNGGQQDGAAAMASPYLHDSGGVLNPGLSTILNNTRKPEAILNSRQWADMHRLATRGSEGAGTQVNINGNVGWLPDQLAQEIEVQKRRTQTMAGMSGVVFA